MDTQPTKPVTVQTQDAVVEQPPVTIQRMPDGRHAVMSPEGNVLGLHKSPFSAARQVHDYFGPVVQGDTEPAKETAEAKHVGSKGSMVAKPSVGRPSVGRPQNTPARVPRP